MVFRVTECFCLEYREGKDCHTSASVTKRRPARVRKQNLTAKRRLTDSRGLPKSVREVGRSAQRQRGLISRVEPSRRTGLGAGAGAGYSGATGKLPSPPKQSPSACRAFRAKRSISRATA